MFFLTAKAIVQLLLLIFSGVLLCRLGLIKHDAVPSINSIMLQLGLPATIIRSFQLQILFDHRRLLLEALALTVYYLVFTILLAFLFVRHGENRGVERAAIGFTNNALVAIPLLTAIFGEIGMFYASATTIVFSFACYNVIPMMLTGTFSVSYFLEKCRNESVAASILALLLLLFHIRLPEFIMTPIGHLANLMTPLAMISIGCMLYHSDIRKVLNLRVIWISFLRLIVTSLIVCFGLRLFIKDEVMLICFCVLTASPSGSLVVILSEQNGIDTTEAMGIFLLTTMACAITIPLIVLLMSGI